MPQNVPDLEYLKQIPERYTRYYSQRRFLEWRRLFADWAIVVRVDHLGRQSAMSIDQAVQAFSRHAEACRTLLETWSDVEISEAGQLAHIRAHYSLLSDGELREGVDLLTLVRLGRTWKIVCLAYEQTGFVPCVAPLGIAGEGRDVAVSLASVSNLADGLANQAERQPEATALHVSGEEFSFRQLDHLVWKACALLKREGVQAGDVLALSFLDDFAAIVAMLACARLGTTIYWLGQVSRALALKMLGDVGAVMLLTDQPGGLGEIPHLQMLPGQLAVSTQPIDHDWRDPAPASPWMIVGGSGSTGRPKHIPLSHRHILAQMAIYNDALKLGPGDRVGSLYSLDSVVARERYLDALSHGAALIIRDKSEPPLDWLARQEVTVVWAPVVQAELLLQQERKSCPDLPRLRAFIIGSSTVSEKLRRRICTGLTKNLHVYYGMNELGLVSMAKPNELFRSPQTVGYPVQGVEVEIVDVDDRPLPVGEIGRVRVRSPGMVEGYLGDDEASRRAFRQGWFHPGDLGRLNEDGGLDYCGRSDHMMIFNGSNIYPAEIEQVMSSHPSVEDVAVMPVRHEWHQDVPVCVVKLFHGQLASERDLMAFAAERLGLRRPRKILFAERIPRNDQGKLIRQALAEWIGPQLMRLERQRNQAQLPIDMPAIPVSLRIAPTGRNVVLDIQDYAESTPEAPALLLPGREISYRTLHELVGRFSAHLMRHGVEAGDLLGVTANNELTLVLIQLAIARLGACVFSLPRSYTAFQRQEVARRTGIRFLVTDDLSRFDAGVPAIEIDGDGLVNDRAFLDHAPLVAYPEVPWLLVTGSGSTGEPKLIPITHAQAGARSQRTARLLGLEASDRVGCLSHFDFSHAKFRLLETLHVGAACALPVWNDADTLGAVRRLSLNVLFSTVFHAERMLAMLPDTAEGVLAGIKILEVTSSTVSDDLRSRIRRQLSPNLFVRYGINEAGPVTIATPGEVASVAGCIGKVDEGIQLHIVDEQGLELANGEVGLVRIRGDGVVAGYVGNPEANRRFFMGGWFFPGDLARIGSRGDLIYYGRADHMMIKNGMNIYPAEIEMVLGAHPEVRDVAVMPISHRVHQDVPFCAVVLSPGGGVSEGELLAYAKERLGARAPERVFCFEHIPRSHEGKLVRKVLHEMLVRRIQQ